LRRGCGRWLPHRLLGRVLLLDHRSLERRVPHVRRFLGPYAQQARRTPGHTDGREVLQVLCAVADVPADAAVLPRQADRSDPRLRSPRFAVHAVPGRHPPRAAQRQEDPEGMGEQAAHEHRSGDHGRAVHHPRHPTALLGSRAAVGRMRGTLCSSGRDWGRLSMDSEEAMKTVLRNSLKRTRETLRWKHERLSERELRGPRTPTRFNLLGVVKHMANVETGYFGDAIDRPWPHRDEVVFDEVFENDPQADWYATEAESAEDVLDLYRRVWAFADETFDSL